MSNPNREWILVDDKMSLEFKAGVAEFMVLARTQVNSQGKVKCPWKQCNNARYQLVKLVEIHLSLKGFTRNYTHWVHHGEERGVIWELNTSSDLFYLDSMLYFDVISVANVIYFSIVF